MKAKAKAVRRLTPQEAEMSELLQDLQAQYDAGHLECVALVAIRSDGQVRKSVIGSAAAALLVGNLELLKSYISSSYNEAHQDHPIATTGPEH